MAGYGLEISGYLPIDRPPYPQRITEQHTMFGAEKGQAGTSTASARNCALGIVQARFNESITNSLAQACKAEELQALGVQAETSTMSPYPAPWKCPSRCRRWPSPTNTTR